MRSCLASRRSVSGWGHVTHGARALQPNGFRFRFIPRKVPGLSANPLGFRGGAGTMVVGKVPPWTAVRQLSRKTRKVHTAAVSYIYIFSSDPSSSLSSQRGIPGHLDRPRRSRPDPSLPLHRHYLRRCCRPPPPLSLPLPSPPHLRSNQEGGALL